MDTDGFMMALKDQLKSRLGKYGMALHDIGLGEFDDSIIIGVPKLVFLVFGNIRCDGSEKDKAFQLTIPPAAIANGDRGLPKKIAKDIVVKMRKELGR